MNIVEDICCFQASELTHVGVVTQPAERRDNAQGKTGILLLHGWGTYRIGPHRLLVDGARHFAAAGYCSYRFDMTARGNSGGDALDTDLIAMSDVIPEAIEAFKRKTGIAKVVVLGLCSGGEVAVASAMLHADIEALCLWSSPLLGRQLIAEDNTRDEKKTSSSKQAKLIHHCREYWRKLFHLASWQKLFYGKINWSMIKDVLFPSSKAGSDLLRYGADNELNRMAAFSRFKGRVLCVFGDADPDAKTAESAWRLFFETHGLSTEFHIVEGANHNYYSLAWKDELLTASLAWLEKIPPDNAK